MYVCVHMYVGVCAYVHRYVYTYVYMYVCMYGLHTCVCMYVCMYVYTYVCMYVCMYYIPGDQVYNTYMGAGRLLDQFLDKIIIIIIFETKNRDPLGAGRLLDQFLDNENCHFDATFGTAFLSSLQVYTLATH